MTPLQWALLCVLFTLYLLFGGSVFMYFEQHREIEKNEEISVLRKDVKEILILLDRDFYQNTTSKEMIHALTTAKINVLHRISNVCNVGDLYPADDIDNHGTTTTTPSTIPENEEDEKLQWSFYNSVFFAFTVITTIGYGHLTPSTNWSKYFLLVYALIGIPLNSILLSGLGDYFSSKLVKVHNKAKDQPEKRFTLIFEILFYLVPGIVVFIIFPAGIFVFIEHWTFLDSVYYAFVSLTTIGFGDLVAGQEHGHTTVWLWVYKSFIIIWITFGLGYLIMILGFITKGLTHKKVRVVIEKRLNTIRFTKEKLSRDIDYMRRVVNELYLMKIKPVYEMDPDSEEAFKAKSKRTQSQPTLQFQRRYSSFSELSTFVVEAADEKKKNSDVIVEVGIKAETTEITKPIKIVRRSSDSDLSHIARDRTFESAIKQQVTVDELLVTVVNALSGNVMADVMEAVEELNDFELEQEILKDDPNHLDHTDSRESSSSALRSQHGSSVSLYERREFDDFPPWDLGALSESDEEVLIEDEDSDALEQVVVHGDGQKTSTTIFDKVSGAIRKISSGSKTASEGPSRKISRNESFKKTSRKNSIERGKISSILSPRPYVNPLAYGHDRDRRLSQQRKISEESRISNVSTKLKDGLHPQGYGSNASSRKISPAHNYDEDRRAKISLESTSLAEFLQALDNVHSRLNSKTSASSMGGEFSTSEDNLPSGLPIIRRSARKSSVTGPENAGRRRKHGIVHPHHAFSNHGFVHDKEAPSTSKPKQQTPPKDFPIPLKKDKT